MNDKFEKNYDKFIRIRKAHINDINQLDNICRKCFKNYSLRTGLKAISLWWWKTSISSDATEVWIAEFNDQIAGFYVLVINEKKWSKDNKIIKILNIFVKPEKIFKYVFKQIKKSKYKHKNKGIIPRNRTWLELIAVDPCFQGKNIGTSLIGHCFLRTKNNCRDNICLLVDSNNSAAKKLYVKSGFLALKDGFGKSTFLKKL